MAQDDSSVALVALALQIEEPQLTEKMADYLSSAEGLAALCAFITLDGATIELPNSEPDAPADDASDGDAAPPDLALVRSFRARARRAATTAASLLPSSGTRRSSPARSSASSPRTRGLRAPRRLRAGPPLPRLPDGVYDGLLGEEADGPPKALVNMVDYLGHASVARFFVELVAGNRPGAEDDDAFAAPREQPSAQTRWRFVSALSSLRLLALLAARAAEDGEPTTPLPEARHAGSAPRFGGDGAAPRLFGEVLDVVVDDDAGEVLLQALAHCGVEAKLAAVVADRSATYARRLDCASALALACAAGRDRAAEASGELVSSAPLAGSDGDGVGDSPRPIPRGDASDSDDDAAIPVAPTTLATTTRSCSRPRASSSRSTSRHRAVVLPESGAGRRRGAERFWAALCGWFFDAFPENAQFHRLFFALVSTALRCRGASRAHERLLASCDLPGRLAAALERRGSRFPHVLGLCDVLRLHAATLPPSAALLGSHGAERRGARLDFARGQRDPPAGPPDIDADAALLADLNLTLENPLASTRSRRRWRGR
ncbi:hypothetical protein JL722_8522 [Aureococcus anophagefferens]|nr:hypothetical protein JL722_8522 [Aureococcus anophagefferens]